MQASFAHTNLVARDWRALASFYERVFGCEPLPPQRDLSGPLVDAATSLAGARIRGAHLRLPGFGDGGPTLEIFQYSPEESAPHTAVNRPGFAHIAFRVESVTTAREEVLAAGGGEVGKVVSIPVAGAGVVTFVYVTDPEGNIIELQSWSPEPE